MFDGVNHMQAMEYERLDSIRIFHEGLILTLKPPLEVRRGMFLLRRQNVDVLYEDTSKLADATPVAPKQPA